MKRTFTLKNLDCAACAAKIENGISKIKGVKNVSVSFMLSKLMLEADDELFDDVLGQARGICKKIEPNCIIV